MGKKQTKKRPPPASTWATPRRTPSRRSLSKKSGIKGAERVTLAIQQSKQSINSTKKAIPSTASTRRKTSGLAKETTTLDHVDDTSSKTEMKVGSNVIAGQEGEVTSPLAEKEPLQHDATAGLKSRGKKTVTDIKEERKAQPTQSLSDRLIGDVITSTKQSVSQVVSNGLDLLFPARYYKREAKRLQRERDASSAQLEEEQQKRLHLEQEISKLKTIAPAPAQASHPALPPCPPPMGSIPAPPPPPPPAMMVAAKKGPYIPKGGVRLIDISGIQLRRNPDRACKKKSQRDPGHISLQDLMAVSLKKTIRPVKQKESHTPKPPMMRQLRKSDVKRSPGGTPMRNKTNESDGEGLTPMLSRALKRKFRKHDQNASDEWTDALEDEPSQSDSRDRSPCYKVASPKVSSPLAVR